jgi:hypothetical protein
MNAVSHIGYNEMLCLEKICMDWKHKHLRQDHRQRGGTPTVNMICCKSRYLLAQVNRTEYHEYCQKGTHKIIRMIISRLASNTDLNFIVPTVPRSLQKILWKQLSILIKLVSGALTSTKIVDRPSTTEGNDGTHIIDQDVNGILMPGYEFCGIILFFSLCNSALQVALKAFLSPRTFHRIRNRRESGRRSILLVRGTQI